MIHKKEEGPRNRWVRIVREAEAGARGGDSRAEGLGPK
jgi:hypothetical protein